MDQGEGARRQGEELSAAATAGAAREVRVGRHLLRADDDQPTFWARVESGRWEPGTLAILDERLRPGTILLDLGAWVGPISLYAAACGARVVAVEADPTALAQLRRNLAANPRLAGRVTVLGRAAAPEPGPVRLGARRKPGDSMSSTLLASASSSWSAEAVTPHELAGMVGRDGALVIKIDIEGGEYALLPSMGPLLERSRCAAIVAFHPEILLEAGGAARPAVPARDVLRPFLGWQSFAIEASGPVPRDPAAHEDGPSGEWLFLKP